MTNRLGPYELNSLIHGDCLDVMPDIPDHSIDMILADLPYGQTACDWDSVIPLEPLWEQYKRVIKPNGAIVLTADEPFTSILILSELSWFRYKATWKKSRPSDFANAKGKLLNITEDIVIFSSATIGNGSLTKMVYNPQGVKRPTRLTYKYQGGNRNRHRPGRTETRNVYLAEWTDYPVNILEFSSVHNGIHPTQKPVPLFAYLILTYSNPGDLILDNVVGSGTTAIAAIETGRNWFCIEQKREYYEAASERIEKRLKQPFLPGLVQNGKAEPEQLELIK